jgi:hypothetical protein
MRPRVPPTTLSRRSSEGDREERISGATLQCLADHSAYVAIVGPSETGGRGALSLRILESADALTCARTAKWPLCQVVFAFSARMGQTSALRFPGFHVGWRDSMRARLALTLFLALPFAAVAATLGGGGDARPLDPSQTFEFSSDPATAAGTYLATQAEGKLKGIKRVAVTNFCVQFVYGKEAHATSSGYWVVYGRTATGAIPGGLSPEKMQAVADAYLDRIEADLRAAGIEVVPYEELAANDMYKKFTAKYDTGIRVVTRETSAAKGGAAGETVAFVSPRGRPFAQDCGTISPMSTSTFVRMSYPLNAEFLTGSAVIDLGQATAGGKFFEQAKADMKLLEYLRAGDSQYQFVGKMGPGARLWLKQSIVPQQNPFVVGAAHTGETTKTTESNMAGTEVTTTRSTETTQSVEFNEALYYENATRMLEAMHRIFMTKITPQ